MSMSQHWPVTTEQRLRNSYLLAHYVQSRREQMFLMLDQAATISGLSVSQWCAVEDGWVPEDNGPVLHALAETLEVGYTQISFIAAVARFNQTGEI